MAEMQAKKAEFKSVSPTDDGQHALYQFEVGGKPLTLAVAEPDLMHLLLLTSQASGVLKGIQKKEKSLNMYSHVSGGNLVYSLTANRLFSHFECPAGLRQVFRSTGTGYP